MLAIWAVILAGIVFWCAASRAQELSNDLNSPGTGSQSATDPAHEAVPGPGERDEPGRAPSRPTGKKLTGSFKFKDPIEETVKELAKTPM